MSTEQQRSRAQIADDLERYRGWYEQNVGLHFRDEDLFALVAEAAAALRSQTTVTPEVTDTMVEAAAKSLLASSAKAYHEWLRNTDSPYSVLRAALEAALQASAQHQQGDKA